MGSGVSDGGDKYLDFTISVSEAPNGEYAIAVLESPAGEARDVRRFPFDDMALDNQLLQVQNALLRARSTQRAASPKHEETVSRFGSEISRFLFDGEVRSRYDVSRERARSENMGLRIKLRVNCQRLKRVPWEYLRNPSDSEFLVLSKATPVVRYPELPHSVEPMRVDGPLRILGMVASPKALAELDVESEQKRIVEALGELTNAGKVSIHWIESQTWRGLQKALRNDSYHIFHFIGHGGFDESQEEGYIALAGNGGELHKLYATQLSRLLGDHPTLRLVVLNSCEGATESAVDFHSSPAASLIRMQVPAVLAMQQEISDLAAQEFARSFYESLADGLVLEEAVTEARKAMDVVAKGRLEWGTPVLYSRAPDGRLFVISRDVGADDSDRPNLKAPVMVTEPTPSPVPTPRPKPEIGLEPPSNPPSMNNEQVEPIHQRETELEPTGFKMNKWVLWALGGAGVLVVAILLVVQYHSGRKRAPDKVTVPRVVGKSEPAARRSLRRAGLTIKVRRRGSRPRRGASGRWLVKRQAPSAGSRVAKGRAVEAQVAWVAIREPVPPMRSSSPSPPEPASATLKMPYVAKISLLSARKILSKLRLTVREDTVVDRRFQEWARVVDQHPKAGETVRAADVVTLESVLSCKLDKLPKPVVGTTRFNLPVDLDSGTCIKRREILRSNRHDISMSARGFSGLRGVKVLSLHRQDANKARCTSRLRTIAALRQTTHFASPKTWYCIRTNGGRVGAVFYFTPDRTRRPSVLNYVVWN